MSLGSIEKHGPTWRVRYTDNTGTRRSKSGFTTKKRAQEWAQRRLDEEHGIGDMGHMTFRELADQYLSQHAAKESTLGIIESRIKGVPFEHTPIRQITPAQIAQWRRSVADQSANAAHDKTRAVRQVLRAAVQWGYLDKSPAAFVKNPKPSAPESNPFRDWAEVQLVADAMPERYRFIPILAVGTGLRPQEWSNLRWEHIDFEGRAINLPHTIAKKGASRLVPLRRMVLDALAEYRQESGPVLDIDGRQFRNNVWCHALTLAEVEYRRPYEMRHTYATWALRAGVSTFLLARRMGTSVDMIDHTYGHLSFDSDAHELRLLDAFDAAHGARVGQREPATTR